MQNYYIHRCSFCSHNIYVMVYFITSVAQISIKPLNLACLPPSTQLWLHLSQCGIPGVQHVWGPCAGETRLCIHTIHILISSTEVGDSVFHCTKYLFMMEIWKKCNYVQDPNVSH